ncbi:MAG: MarR family transcriptional regulator [Aestuariivirga sp.]|uniref:MarR family transcriptional regulator n=1 Tax=Aestuariivirga sp. TaxID=2650926 RepID=UPI003016BC26
MNASIEIDSNGLDALNVRGSSNEDVDAVSRTIIIEIAKANGHPVRQKDIVRSFDLDSHVAVHKQLRRLVESNLVASERNPTDRRERLLYLTPLAQEKFDRLAQEIRQLGEK